MIDATLSPTVVRDGAFTAERSAIAAVLCGKLGMVFRLIDRFGEARAAVLDGLARAPDEDRLLVARLQGSLSNIEMQDRRYDAALAAADAAEESLGPGPFEDEERAETWALVQLCGRASVHFILLELGKAASEIERARPFVEAGGSQQLRSYLLLAEGWLHLGERRFRVDEEIVDEWRRIADPARWAAAAADGSGVLMWFFQRPEPLRCLALSWLGSVLTWHGELGEARRVHEEALATRHAAGLPRRATRVLVDLATIAIREGDVEAVRELATEGLTSAAGGEFQHATGAAIALQAWVAWRDRRLEAVIELAWRALEQWSVQDMLMSPFQFLALWPLIGAHLELGHLEEALAAGRRMLDPSQARLPDELEAALHEACESWERADPELARRQLFQALQLARDLAYA